jgi:hypothetical protein
VFESFRLAPVSEIVYRRIRQGVPDAISFTAWFTLPEVERKHRRLDLYSLRPDVQDSAGPNYEAQQAPLSYILLAPLDWLMSSLPLTSRVLVLRLVVAISSTLLLFFGAARLCRELSIPEPFATAVLFTMFSSEMLYATTAHVANDWLAVLLAAWVFSAWVAFVKKPSLQTALVATAWLAAGLITKAYFLAFAVWAVAIVCATLWQRRIRVQTVLASAILVLVFAGPWYARNLILYRNVIGTYRAFNGTGIRQTLAAVPRLDWPAATGFLARGSIWTGNNSFTSYSRTTLNIMLALLILAIAAWARHRRAIQPAEQVVFAGIVLFAGAIAYASCADFADSHGEFQATGPWYSQLLLAPVMALAYLGMSRSNWIGRMLAICTVELWTWVLCATWTIKLFPMYSGAGTTPMRPRDIWSWYAHGAIPHASDLSLTALAPAPVLYAGLVVSLALSLVLSTKIVGSLAFSPFAADDGTFKSN